MYKCEIDGCDRMVKIRATIKNKDSEFYGKKVCQYHASLYKKKPPISSKTMKTNNLSFHCFYLY